MEKGKFSKGQLAFIRDMQKVLRRYGQDPEDWQFDYIPTSQQEPDHKAMWEVLEEQVKESRKAIVRSQFNVKLEELLEKVRAKHTPQAEVKKEE